MAVSSPTTVITQLGLLQCATAIITGPQIELTGVRIGSALIDPIDSMTDVVDLVYTDDVDVISYQIIDNFTVSFKITLNREIGDFDIGNIGLFTSDGMFAISALHRIEHKLSDATSGGRGNTRIYMCLIKLSGNADIIMNFQNLIEMSASLPVLANETLLPLPASTSDYSCYVVSQHTLYQRSALAVRWQEDWYYIPVDFNGYGVRVGSSAFDSSVNIGDIVYYDKNLLKFYKADPNQPEKDPIAVRESLDFITIPGMYHTNLAGSFTPGAKYYCDSGVNAGKFTTDENYVQFGVAVSTTIMLLIMPQVSNSGGIDTLRELNDVSIVDDPIQAQILFFNGSYWTTSGIENIENNDILIWNQSNLTWENTPLELDSLNDVSIALAPVLGQILFFNGSQWVPNELTELSDNDILVWSQTELNWINTALELDSLNDVSIIDGSEGQIIEHDGAEFTNSDSDTLSTNAFLTFLSDRYLRLLNRIVNLENRVEDLE